jgi:hypothetical protein
MNRWAVLLQLILLMLPVAGCRQSLSASAKVEAKGLHNVYRITDKLISGSSPEGDEGFRSLKELGIKTIISIYGARPDLDHARKYGLRYVHLPTESAKNSLGFRFSDSPRRFVICLAQSTFIATMERIVVLPPPLRFIFAWTRNAASNRRWLR